MGDRAKDRLANAGHLRTMSSIGSIMKKLQRKAGMQAKVASSGPRPRPSANSAAPKAERPHTSTVQNARNRCGI